MSYAPCLIISAHKGKGLRPMVDAIFRLHEQNQLKISTAQLNRVLEDSVKKHPPARDGAQHVKIYYATQTGSAPLTFTFFANRPRSIHDEWKRFLAKSLRQQLGCPEVPLRLIFKERR